MAKRQITIDDGTKGRQQVSFNLSPQSLTPTISGGGNYRVAVQDTPKTNSAQQLSEAFGQGLNIYKQATNFATDKAQRDVEGMSDEDYEKFLVKGLDPEARNVFGYTKEYNRQLAQKYYATEIPTKLSEVSAEMQKEIFEYKDTASFQQALEERMGAVYEEADNLLTGNPFGDKANNALKAATRADFINREVQKFNTELPKRNQEMARETISRSFEGVSAGNVEAIFSAANAAYESNQPLLGDKATGDSIFAAVEVKLSTLIDSTSSSDHALAQELLDTIGDGKQIEKSGGISKLVGGNELFATGDRQAKLNVLEYKLEQRREDENEEALKNYDKLSSSIGAGATLVETDVKRKVYLDGITKALQEGAPLPDGTIVDNDFLRDKLQLYVFNAKNNPTLFKKENAVTFINQNQKSTKIFEESFALGLGDTFMSQNPLRPGVQEFNERGLTFLSEFRAEMGRQYNSAYVAVSGIEDPNKKQLAFLDEEIKIGERLKEWKELRINSASTQKEESVAADVRAAVETIGEEEARAISAQYPTNPQAAEKVILHEAEQSRLEDKNSITNTSAGMTIPAGLRKKTRFDNFIKILGLKNVTSEDLLTSQSVIHKDTWEGNVFGTPIKTFSFNMVYGRPTGTESVMGEVGATNLVERTNAGFAQRMRVGQEAAEVIKKAGIPDSVLLSGVLPSHANAKKQSISFFFENNFLSLSSAPIILDGSLENTLTAVQAWDDGGQTMDNVDDKHKRTLNQIAEKYELSMSELMNFQKTYLTKNGYLK